jgi:hypothetical protein
MDVTGSRNILRFRACPGILASLPKQVPAVLRTLKINGVPVEVTAVPL